MKERQYVSFYAAEGCFSPGGGYGGGRLPRTSAIVVFIWKEVLINMPSEQSWVFRADCSYTDSCRRSTEYKMIEIEAKQELTALGKCRDEVWCWTRSVSARRVSKQMFVLTFAVQQKQKLTFSSFKVQPHAKVVQKFHWILYIQTDSNTQRCVALKMHCRGQPKTNCLILSALHFFFCLKLCEY